MKKISIALVFLLGIFSAPVFAQKKADMSLAGKPASTFNAATGEYILTNAVKHQTGSIWSKDFIDLNDNFTIEADVYLGTGRNGNFGDGIAFVLQPLCTGLGTHGSGLGYQGINPSFAVEFDNVSNGLNNDPAEDHIGFMLNGNPRHGGANDLGTFTEGRELEDGNYHPVVISWDATNQQMTVEVDEYTYISRKPTKDIVQDASMFNGKNLVYWGFTASTGDWVNEHKIKLKKWPARNIVPYNVTDATMSQPNSGKIEISLPDEGQSYIWSNGSTGRSISNLSKGDYSVTITDRANCKSKFTIKVNEVATLIGHWTFEKNNEMKDLMGNFSDLVSNGATVTDGKLKVGANSYAGSRTYTGPNFNEKTLVAWAIVNTGGQQGGSILTIGRPNPNYDFDAIVYGERQTNTWMAGSGWYHRTKDFGKIAEETTPDELVKIAISYGIVNNKAHMTIYRNDEKIAEYTMGSMLEWTKENTGVLFGFRHYFNGLPGKPWLDAQIEEARIYEGVLSQEQISNLTVVK